jgi:acylphosphatase
MKALRLVIHGRVQGVGYRYAMVEAASGLRIAGWVRNRRDGTVEAFVQGDAAAVEAALAWCRSGPRGARVEDVEAFPAAPDSTIRDFADHPTT